MRNVVEQADVVLYLVDASQAPEAQGWLDAELRVLDLIGKPVIVLLNQLGPAAGEATSAAELAGWRARLAQAGGVREVLALDAFTRCWVQEDRLLDRIAPLLPAARRPAFAALQAAWQARSAARLRASADAMAACLRRAMQDREALPEAGWGGRLREVGSVLGLRGEAGATPAARAMRELAARLDRDLADTTDRLIALHGLDGSAAREIRQRLADHYAQQLPVSVGKAAGWGGATAGALAGLKADIATGGLTLGGGLLVGALLGALGGAGVASAVNKVRGVEQASVEWSAAALEGVADTLLMSYLAVAHHGRGRGEWFAGTPPAHWHVALQQSGETTHHELELLTSAARSPSGDALRHIMEQRTWRTLRALYPEDAPRNP